MRLARRPGALVALLLALLVAACASPEVVPDGGGIADIDVVEPVGLPDGKVIQLESRLRDRLAAKGVAVAGRAGDPAPYRLQSFCSAAPDSRGAALACVFDVLDPAGEQATRVVTEDTVRGRRGDPWALVTGDVLDRVAETAAAEIANWLPANRGFFSAPGPLITLGGRRFFVGRISGAPGDGNTSLSAAMVRALKAEGETVVPSATAAYRVDARVEVTRPRSGNQEIRIEWRLLDREGRLIGNVAQENRIRAGALEPNWGQNADNAAGAAAKGIIQLVPAG